MLDFLAFNPKDQKQVSLSNTTDRVKADVGLIGFRKHFLFFTGVLNATSSLQRFLTDEPNSPAKRTLHLRTGRVTRLSYCIPIPNWSLRFGRNQENMVARENPVRVCDVGIKGPQNRPIPRILEKPVRNVP